MAAMLKVIDGPQLGAVCRVREGQRVVVGRGYGSDFQILDPWASRLHCAITYRPDGIIVEDLNTKNGTFVGGKRVHRARVPDGAIIQLGTTTIQLLMKPTHETVAGAAPVRRRRAAAVVALVALAACGLAGGGLFVASRLKSKPLGNLPLIGGPRAYSIDVTSEPPGATVFIDEEFRGATPLKGIEVEKGKHLLRIQKAGYEVHRAPLDLSRKPSGPIHVVLRLAQRGILVVNSRPEGAAVYLNGEYRGNTPLRLEDLEPQAYDLRLTKTNFADWQGEVKVEANKAVKVEATLGHREIAYYEAELKKDPNNVSYHTEVAHLYLLEQKVDPCIAHLRQALEITIAGRDTTRPEPYTRRLVWLLQKIYYNNYFNYGDTAFVRMVQGRIDSMMADLITRHLDSSLMVSAARKLYKSESRDLLGAKAAAYEALTAKEPNNLDHYLRAAAFLLMSREYHRAEAVLQRACKASPADHRPYLALGRLYLGMRRHGSNTARQKAIQALNAALARCDDEPTKAIIRRLLGKATS